MDHSSTPWVIAPVSPQGDDTPDNLYRAVGLALSTWEQVDEVCAWIFAVLVDSRNGAAELAYGSVVASTARLEMIKVAAGRVIHQDHPLQTELNNLLTITGKLGARRNEIAHGIVSGYEVLKARKSAPVAKASEAFTHKGYYLVPASYATRKRGSPVASSPQQFYLQGTYAYVAGQVAGYSDAFGVHGLKLRDLLIQKIMPHCRKHWPPHEAQE